MWIGKRLEFCRPEFSKDVRWKVWGWHGSDEYGNCSIYFKLPLIGGLTFFYELDFQTDVLVPCFGVNEWVDRRQYPDLWQERKEAG